MTTEFENKGIRIYKDMLVAQWNDGTDCTEIKWVTFTSNDQPLRLECSVSMWQIYPWKHLKNAQYFHCQ